MGIGQAAIVSDRLPSFLQALGFEGDAQVLGFDDGIYKVGYQVMTGQLDWVTITGFGAAVDVLVDPPPSVNLFVSSTSVSDTDGVMTLEGLDENNDYQSVSQALDAVDSQVKTRIGGAGVLWNRVNRMSLTSTTDNRQNKGFWAVYEDDGTTGGLPNDLDKIWTAMRITDGHDSNSIYTVPNDKVALIVAQEFGGSVVGLNGLHFRLQTREPGGIFYTRAVYSSSSVIKKRERDGGSLGQSPEPQLAFLLLQPNTMVKVQAKEEVGPFPGDVAQFTYQVVHFPKESFS